MPPTHLYTHIDIIPENTYAKQSHICTYYYHTCIYMYSKSVKCTQYKPFACLHTHTHTNPCTHTKSSYTQSCHTHTHSQYTDRPWPVHITSLQNIPLCPPCSSKWSLCLPLHRGDCSQSLSMALGTGHEQWMIKSRCGAEEGEITDRTAGRRFSVFRL